MKAAHMLIAMALALASANCLAAGHPPARQQKPADGAQPAEKKIEEKQLEGSVEVSFSLDAQGKIRIVQIVASSQELADYVIKKMSDIQLDKNDTSQIGKIIKYRFVFKKQA
jgi:hypothetical protein